MSITARDVEQTMVIELDGDDRNILVRIAEQEQVSPQRMLLRLIDRYDENAAEERRLAPLFAEMNEALDAQMASIKASREETATILASIKERNQSREANAA